MSTEYRTSVHDYCDHAYTSSARRACRKARAAKAAAAHEAQLALIAAYDKVGTGNDRMEQAAAVIHYFATTDYHPTSSPDAMVQATLRRAS